MSLVNSIEDTTYFVSFYYEVNEWRVKENPKITWGLIDQIYDDGLWKRSYAFIKDVNPGAALQKGCTIGIRNEESIDKGEDK